MLKYVAASSGSGEKDFLKLKEIVAAVPKVGNIYLSVGLVFINRSGPILFVVSRRNLKKNYFKNVVFIINKDSTLISEMYAF